jgi:glycosyltransferase involved in cell wall biosynthesis
MAKGGLRVALLAYRGNPYSGGQGVYVRHLARELTALGHEVTVISGQPYPELDPTVRLLRLPSLDLYRAEDPFRTPGLKEFRDWVDVLEYLHMCTAGFPEPLTFSLRARRLLRARRGEFDIVHDNQCLGYGLLDLPLPRLATIHHPIEVDRELELLNARGRWKRMSLRRWYGFARMQRRVARRTTRIITGTEISRRDISQRTGVPAGRIAVIPIGVDAEAFCPCPEVARVPGRILATASADIPLKGLLPLMQAMAEVRLSRPAELVVVGRPRDGSDLPSTMRRLGLNGSVRFVNGIPEAELVRLHAESEIAVVPSLYEGFSLPAVQAMAMGLPVVATTGGALPEVLGSDGETALLVPPGDAAALSRAMGRLLDDPGLRQRIGEAGQRRALTRYSWRAAAEATVAEYRRVIESAC